MQEMENAVEDSRWRIAKTITDSCDLLDATLDGDADYVARAIDQALTTKHTSDWYNVFQSELIADCTDITGIGERLSPVDGSGTCPQTLVSPDPCPQTLLYRVSNPFSSYPSLINPTFMSSGRYNLSFFLNSNTLVYFI